MTIIITAIITTIVWYIAAVVYTSMQVNNKIVLFGFAKSIKDTWYGRPIPVYKLKAKIIHHVIFRRDVAVPGFLLSTDYESIICLSDQRCYTTFSELLPQTIKDNTKIIIFDDDSKLTPDQEKQGIVLVRRYFDANRFYME